MSTEMLIPALGFGATMGALGVVLIFEWVDRTAALKKARRDALHDAAAVLRRQGLAAIAADPASARGAGLWDAGCYIDPDDHDGLGAGAPRPRLRLPNLEWLK